ncbi:MAG: hypothetical protein DKM50_05645 [Candidatus Margulisiibacteriota bacterium]|nr:MAG: hypothetical protein DKM50_05645 [Candidatus Margulisiibacteriota bacterium]
MNDRIRKSFLDIISASEEINDFVKDKTFSEFEQSRLLQKALEREFEIVGEALYRIKRIDEEILASVSEYQRIIGFRNILAHGYDIIDERLVWDAVTKHLPVLIKEINHILTT